MHHQCSIIQIKITIYTIDTFFIQNKDRLEISLKYEPAFVCTNSSLVPHTKFRHENEIGPVN